MTPVRPLPLGRDATLQFAVGVAGLVLSGLAAHDRAISPTEATAFRTVNGLPDRLYRPAWVLMQAGNVNAAPVAAVFAVRSGRRRLAARITVTGLLSWALAKVIKRLCRRPRPAALLEGVRCRGKEPTGLGYVSGHAAVSAGIVATALPVLTGPARIAGTTTASTVGLCRMYVGAHLPLDVVGGTALGMAVSAFVDWLIPDSIETAAPRHRAAA